MGDRPKTGRQIRRLQADLDPAKGKGRKKMATAPPPSLTPPFGKNSSPPNNIRRTTRNATVLLTALTIPIFDMSVPLTPCYFPDYGEGEGEWE